MISIYEGPPLLTPLFSFSSTAIFQLGGIGSLHSVRQLQLTSNNNSPNGTTTITVDTLPRLNVSDVHVCIVAF